MGLKIDGVSPSYSPIRLGWGVSVNMGTYKLPPTLLRWRIEKVPPPHPIIIR